MSAEIIIYMDYQGYTYMGHAQGNMEDEKTHERRIRTSQMFVLSPVSSYKSEDYCASGLKAEKKRCVSPDVWVVWNPAVRSSCSSMTRSAWSWPALDS